MQAWWLTAATEFRTERHRGGSTLIASNRDPAEWHPRFTAPLGAKAAIERFADATCEPAMKGDSYRPRLPPRSGTPRMPLRSGATHAAAEIRHDPRAVAIRRDPRQRNRRQEAPR